MRHQLAALDDQLVLITGHWKEHRKRGDKGHLLLSGVKVYLFKDNDTAYGKETPVCKVDHLWCTEDGTDNVKGRELYTEVFFVGRVKPYYRSNGSKDYGVVGEPFQDLESLFWRVIDKAGYIKCRIKQPAPREYAYMQLYLSAIDVCKITDQHLVGKDKSPKEWLTCYTNLLERARGRYAKACKAERKDKERRERKRVSPHSGQAARGFA